MIWVGILLVIGVVFLVLLAVKIAEDLGIIRHQLGSLLTRVQDVHGSLESADNHLSSIESHSARQAQSLYAKDELERRESEENPFYYAQRDGI